MSDLFVDNIKHQSSQGSGTITLGASGETVSLASGASQNMAVNTPAFGVVLGGGTYSVANSTSTLVPYDTELFDTDSAYDLSTNKFTVPSGKAGKYFFTARTRISSTTNCTRLVSQIYVNGSVVQEINANNDDEVSVGGSHIVSLSVGDYVQHFVLQNTGASKNFFGDNQRTFFGGYKLIGI